MEPTTTIYDKILEDIKSGRIPTGCVIAEVELARMYGVSRTPVREALRVLEHQGLVKRERTGIRVIQPQPAEILQIYDVRILLEQEAARLAAIHRSDFDLSILRAGLRSMHRQIQADPHHLEGIESSNHRFHAAVHAASHNDVLVEILERLEISLSRFHRTTMEYPGRLEMAMAQHDALLVAIEEQRSEQAMKVACEHFRDARVIRLLQYGEEFGESPAASPLDPMTESGHRQSKER